MVTQLEIAREVGLDVSSVNKILCGVPGPVFADKTKAKVFRVAKRMGWNFARENKHSLRRDKAELKAVVEDLYNTLFGMGYRSFKPETLATIQKHFEQHKAKARSTA